MRPSQAHPTTSQTPMVDERHACIVAAAGDQPVTLVGESFGGALSLSYAPAHPERVARLVILNSFPDLLHDITGADAGCPRRRLVQPSPG